MRGFCSLGKTPRWPHCVLPTSGHMYRSIHAINGCSYHWEVVVAFHLRQGHSRIGVIVVSTTVLEATHSDRSSEMLDCRLQQRSPGVEGIVAASESMLDALDRTERAARQIARC